LAGDVDGLGGVVLADAARHKETLDDAEDGGDTGPEEQEIQDSEAVAAEIEVVGAEAAEKEREEEADDFIFVGAFVFCVEPGTLLVVHVGGVDGVDGVHDVGPLADDKEMYADGGMIVPNPYATQ